jgi:hypothetical protein
MINMNNKSCLLATEYTNDSNTAHIDMRLRKNHTFIIMENDCNKMKCITRTLRIILIGCSYNVTILLSSNLKHSGLTNIEIDGDLASVLSLKIEYVKIPKLDVELSSPECRNR